MPNPFMGYDDPYYHNHDPNVNAKFDEEWFQGRDEEVLETSSGMPLTKFDICQPTLSFVSQDPYFP